jgi:hypothetical protein
MKQIFLLQPADMIEDMQTTFYVIEKFHEPQFLMNEDGSIKTFDNYQDANAEAEGCQQGFVITF